MKIQWNGSLPCKIIWTYKLTDNTQTHIHTYTHTLKAVLDKIEIMDRTNEYLKVILVAFIKIEV